MTNGRDSVASGGSFMSCMRTLFVKVSVSKQMIGVLHGGIHSDKHHAEYKNKAHRGCPHRFHREIERLTPRLLWLRLKPCNSTMFGYLPNAFWM